MKKNERIAELRREYSQESLLEADVAPNPFDQFRRWFEKALVTDGVAEPNAMTLATATSRGAPSARIVLLKEYDERGFVFFTNYESRKGKELLENPEAALLFFWTEMERQIQIVGTVKKVSTEISEKYFKTRPRESKIGAWASHQSSIIQSREELEERFQKLQSKFHDHDIPLPPTWGGYCLSPNRFEFWQGRQSRLHDRLEYRMTDGKWKVVRLAP